MDNSLSTSVYIHGEDFHQQNVAALLKLQEQRSQITNYIMELAKLKSEINRDPLSAVNKCFSLKTSAPTTLDAIEKVPVDASKLYSNSLKAQNYNTRKLIGKQWNDEVSNPATVSSKEPNSEVKIRGKIKVDATASFNKLWTEEEQLLLEHLLQVYPFETSELARCKKIASAMGTRTPKQIRSRMQKYYKKLKVFDKYVTSTTATSEVKGVNKKVINNINKLNTKVFRKSTFLPRYNVQEYISNEESILPPANVQSTQIKQEAIDSDMKSDILTQLDAFRLEDSLELEREHVGYKCVACEQDPIIGPRWHCVSCIQRTDLCCSCMREYVEMPQLLVSDQHKISHPFEAIITPPIGTFNDPDYFLHNFDSNNYLDPNFLPE